MRFHMGVSFSWRTIKKFLFPFILGLLAYFGINFLGLGIINVYANENYDTAFDISYKDIESVYNKKIDDTHSYLDFFNSINSINSEYYNSVIGHTFYYDNQAQGYINSIDVYLIPKSFSSISTAIYGYGMDIRFYFSLVVGYKGFQFHINDFSSDFTQNSNYIALLDCLNNNNSCSTSVNISASRSFAYCDTLTNIVDNSNYTCYIPLGSSSTSYTTRIIYSSQVPIYYSNSNLSGYLNNANYHFKKIIFNGKELQEGDYIDTYKEYLDNLPIDDGNDNDNTTEHKALFNKIYWFDDNSTDLGVLTSIYEVLFLYCLTMILFKILTFLKNMRW